MSEISERDFEKAWWSEDKTEVMVQFVRNQQETLNLAIQHIMQADDTGPRHATLLPLTLSALRCCSSLEQIGDKFEHLRDVYIISRSLLEIVVNTLFILNSPDEIAESAHQHAAQKSLRDLRRKSEIAGWIIELNPDADELPASGNLQEALDRYTGAKGQEIRTWTSESLPARIAVAALNSEPRAGVLLHGAFFLIYRHASELLHGTLFGSLFEMGLTVPDSDEDPPLTRYGTYVNDHLATVLWMDGELVHLLAKRLSDHLGVPELLTLSAGHRSTARAAMVPGTTRSTKSPSHPPVVIKRAD
ncbi:MAG: hypothetical protein O3A10_11240 [Chloroflexi bacterium]|nr:hypothetical protein [Chloroflexota bacterium]MDA1146990.1 hypothetical protein [Chloroflexota bacterium]